MRKVIKIINAQEATDIGSMVYPHLTDFEVEGPEEMEASDGYHTFDELYEHRVVIFITLCRAINTINGFARRAKLHDSMTTPVWRSKLHSDGTMFDDVFILGLNKEAGSRSHITSI